MSIPRDRRDEKNQVVTDAQGRRRFHGAFTGGFSAGYYNTVGSEEGWTPSEYKSSKSRRQRKCDFSLFVVRFPIF
jgi:G patch domain-containing protein 1